MSRRALAPRRPRHVGLGGAVALVLVVALGCSARSDFGSGSFSDVANALEANELEVCRVIDDPGGLANGATATRTFVVAIDCTDGERTELVVDRFGSADARDAAARQFEVVSRPRGSGVVWTLGPFTIFAGGGNDDEVLGKITDALAAVGAR